MKKMINKIIDSLSNYFAYRKGLLPFLGILLILLNWMVQFFPSFEWLAATNTLLHIGIIVSIMGLMMAWAL